MLNGGSCSSAVVAAREYVDRAKVPFLMLNASGDGALYPQSNYISGAFSISQHAVGGSMGQFAAAPFNANKIGYINQHHAYTAWTLDATKLPAHNLPIVKAP